MKRLFEGAVVVLFAALLAGCASSSVQMIARRNSPDAPTSTVGIALAKHPQPRPEEQRLNHVLTEVLKSNGHDDKSPSEADYVLAYWIEENWDEVIPIDSGRSTRQDKYEAVAGNGDPTGGRMAGESFNSLKDEEVPPSRFISKKGVKLTLYSNRAPMASRLTPVWEGYIEVGSTESSAQLKAAVQNLLAHFGKDFTGRVRL